MYLSTRHAGNGRGFWSTIDNGEVIVKGGILGWSKEKIDVHYTIEKGIPTGYREYYVDTGKLKEVTIYGKYMKQYDKDGKVTSYVKYRKGSTRAVEYKRKRYGLKQTSILPFQYSTTAKPQYKVTIYTSCNRGGFRHQRAVYKNGKIAYHMKYKDKEFTLKYPDGKIWVKATTNYRFNSAYTQGYSVLKDSLRNSDGLSVGVEFCGNGYKRREDIEMSIEVYDTKGELQTSGKYVNRQKVDKWLEEEGSKEKYYIQGVKLSKELYFAKPEDINPYDVLKIKNAQLRTTFLRKIGIERVIQKCKGEIIHTDGDMELIEIKVDHESWEDSKIRILKVLCPSTKVFYALQVPPDVTTCVQARNWTFGVNPRELDSIKVEFSKET